MSGAPPASLATVAVPGDPGAWAAAGLTVAGSAARVGAVTLEFAGACDAPAATFLGLTRDRPDGLAFTAGEPAAKPASGDHPLGVTRIDHLVALTPDLDRTVEALQCAGLDLRRIREEPTPAGAPRQAFFRAGEVILEIVQEPEERVCELGADRPAMLWGMALAIVDMNRASALLGASLGAPRPAVQPGRTIATVKRGAGLSIPLALITERGA